jgi:membrane-associated protease RseP (regulator of RpoE activity)
MVGAFSLQNLWPLPLVLMVAVILPEGRALGATLSMPDWWPLVPVQLAPGAGHILMYEMMPVVAALGYGDVAVSSMPGKRRHKSAQHLAYYSVILLGLSLLSVHMHWLAPLAALLSPLGHEFLIQWDNRSELEKTPRFVPPESGIMVLDTLAKAPAQRAGIRAGDVLLELDTQAVNSRTELETALNNAPAECKVVIKRDLRSMPLAVNFEGHSRLLGIITVPEGNEPYYIEISTERFMLWDRLKKLLQRISRK